MYLQVLVALAGAVQHAPPPQHTATSAYVSPQLAKFRPLIDSLSVAAGSAPDSVLFRGLPSQDWDKGATGLIDPAHSTVVVSPVSEDKRQTLMHEMGHWLSFQDMSAFNAWFDAGGQQTRDVVPRDLEDFANDFATAFRTLHQDAKHSARVQALRDLIQSHLKRKAP